jgi:hypothetical protein
MAIAAAPGICAGGEYFLTKRVLQPLIHDHLDTFQFQIHVHATIPRVRPTQGVGYS